MRLILLRHGETDWNAADRYQGATDVPLNATGERQARAAAAGAVGDLLLDAGPLVALCSPLVRARETARIVLEASLGAVEAAVEPDLAELGGGHWEGLALREIAERWPAEHAAWRAVPDLDAGPVGGERLRDGGARVLRAIERHAPAGSAGADGVPTLLVVAHGAVLRSAVGQLLGAEGEDFATLERIRNARAVVLEGEDPAGRGPAAWMLLGYNV